jgi:hypothetical protein
MTSTANSRWDQDWHNSFHIWLWYYCGIVLTLGHRAKLDVTPGMQRNDETTHTLAKDRILVVHIPSIKQSVYEIWINRTYLILDKNAPTKSLSGLPQEFHRLGIQEQYDSKDMGLLFTIEDI